MNVGGLFQWLNSDTCLPFYVSLTPDNRADILEQCLSNEEFVGQASEFVQDIGILRQKLDTKLGQMCKKMSNTSVATSANTIVATSANTIVATSANTIVATSANTIINPMKQYMESDTILVEDTGNMVSDPDKGTHIGSGFYLKREGHLIKMTSPEWVIYY